MNHPRRTFLKSAGAVGTIAAAAAAGLLKPTQVLAADWNKSAFTADKAVTALANYGVSSPSRSKDVLLHAPDIAENGAVVPVTITSHIPNTEMAFLVIADNPNPLAAVFTFANGAEGFISTRVKMAKTSYVKAYVKANGKYYFAEKQVKVTIGGCGG